MAEKTSIEWCDHTFNPWIGCEKVSPGCDNCYAAQQDKFRHWTPEGWGGPRKRTKTWGDPVKWNAQHDAFMAQHGRRQRVFCASLGDVFDNQVPVDWRVELLHLIARTPHLDWLLLTKRIGNAQGMLNVARAVLEVDCGSIAMPFPWPNIWLGATVVNQEEADRDIPKLLATPAAVRFLSMEPLLGPVRLPKFCACGCRKPFDEARQETIDDPGYLNPEQAAATMKSTLGIDWVIVGGESGPNARPMHRDWLVSLRDQCAAAGVRFLFKQWGEWRATSADAVVDDRQNTLPMHVFRDGQRMAKVGKKAAGRLLDGVTHAAFPEVK